MSDFVKVASCSSRLQEALEIRQMKPVDLANATGLSKSSISRYLSGEMEPKNTPTYKMARALDVSEQWLWGYDMAMERPQSQKESDAISDITVKLMRDKEFLSVMDQISKDEELYALVKKVCSLDEEKRRSWSNLL